MIATVRMLAAVARAPSMSAASRVLRVDKATVSRHLAQLERERPGLFERRGGRIELTAAGMRAVAALDDVEHSLRAFDSVLAEGVETTGSVRLTMPAPIAAELVVPALPKFRAAHPGIDVVLFATSRVLDMGRGEADVGLRNFPAAGSAVVARRVATIHTALYASRAYLERRGAPDGRDFDGHDFLDFEAGTHNGPGFEWLPAAVRRARVALRADDPRLLAQACAAGLGLSVLPGFLAANLRDVVRVGSDRGQGPVFLVVRAEVRRHARVRAVASWFGDLITSHGKWLGAT
jgi:DNA-binding transcriptional LysR family regulator